MAAVAALAQPVLQLAFEPIRLVAELVDFALIEPDAVTPGAQLDHHAPRAGPLAQPAVGTLGTTHDKPPREGCTEK
jgi:hypothetical protein